MVANITVSKMINIGKEEEYSQAEQKSHALITELVTYNLILIVCLV